MEERKIETYENIEQMENKNALENDKGFALMYNITMVSACATVAMFVLGTILYLAIVL